MRGRADIAAPNDNHFTFLHALRLIIPAVIRFPYITEA